MQYCRYSCIAHESIHEYVINNLCSTLKTLVSETTIDNQDFIVCFEDNLKNYIYKIVFYRNDNKEWQHCIQNITNSFIAIGAGADIALGFLEANREKDIDLQCIVNSVKASSRYINSCGEDTYVTIFKKDLDTKNIRKWGNDK